MKLARSTNAPSSTLRAPSPRGPRSRASRTCCPRASARSAKRSSSASTRCSSAQPPRTAKHERFVCAHRSSARRHRDFAKAKDKAAAGTTAASLVRLLSTSERRRIRRARVRALASARSRQRARLVAEGGPGGASSLGAAAVLARTAGAGEVARGLTSATCVSACGKLPSMHCARIVLLGEQARVVAEREQPFEQLLGLVATTRHGEVVGEPKRAREKDALAGRQTVDPICARVTQHETIDDEILLDGPDDEATITSAAKRRVIRRSPGARRLAVFTEPNSARREAPASLRSP